MKNKRLPLYVFVLLFLIFLSSQGKKEIAVETILQSQISPKPQAIVSLSLSADEMLLSLVEKERIKALTYLSTDLAISNVWQEARAIKEQIYANTEKVISLNPDLVITSSFTPPEMIKTLHQAGIRVYVFPLSNSLQEVKENILGLAEAVGETERGLQLVAQMEEKEKEISERMAKQGRKRIRILYYGFSGDTCGEGTQFNELVQKAGLVNIAAEKGIKGRANIDKEQLIQLNPEVIFVPNWLVKVRRGSVNYDQYLLEDTSLVPVEAVRKKNVYPLQDRHFTCSSQYIVYAIEDLADLACNK